MRYQPSAHVASVAEVRTELAIREQLGWLFREQRKDDYGIDAHVEVVDGDVRGRLLALQIKGGASRFKEPGSSGWWFRPERSHVEYWRNHSLPVVIVLYHPDTKLCHWQLIGRETLVSTSTGGWKVLVPEAHVIDESAREALQTAAEADPYILRVRELRLAKPWMDLLVSGSRLVVDIEEWINKSSGRGSIMLGIDNEDGHEPAPLARWYVFLGSAGYAEAIPRLFAWADVDLHEETYDDAAYDLYELECSVWDEGEQFFGESYGDWRKGRFPDGLRPYADDGEIGYWRLELTLNDLGEAFLLLDKFAEGGGNQLMT